MQSTTIILVIVLVVLLVVAIFGGIGMMGFGSFGMMKNGMMGGYGYGHNPLGAILSFASWALIVVGIVLLGVWLVRNAGKNTSSNESPLDILKTRYARGEITKEQFDAMQRDLNA